jgi:hypothetical protein
MSTEQTKEQYEELMKVKDSKNFKFYVPLEDSYIEKSLKLEKEDSDPTSWKLGGIASSNEEDLEGEIVIPGGIDTSYFLSYGYINNNHLKGSENKIGIPTKAELNSKGLYIEGYLLKSHPASKIIYETLKEMAKNKFPRRGGWSIEGKTVLQEGKKIIKSWLLDVAFTFSPVNQTTYADVLKSLKTCAEDNSLESIDYLSASSVDKTLEAGYAVEGQTDGGALRQQDLESKLKVLINKGLSYDEAVGYIILKSGASLEAAKKILDNLERFN